MLISVGPCAVFAEDKDQRDAHCKIRAEVKQAARAFGKVEETDVNKCGDCDEDD